MGSTPHHHQDRRRIHQNAHTNLEQQVEELEKEIEKHRELRGLWRKRLERTQDYLRHCLQLAQENGFLDIINNNNNNAGGQLQESLLPSYITGPPPPIQYHCHLSQLSEQAKINGWYIHPHEIELGEKVGHGSTAEIHMGTWRGLDVAVKCLDPDFFLSNHNGVAFFAQEVETLSRQRHPFVLRLIGACLDPPEHAWIVTEVFTKTLNEWLHGPGGRGSQRTAPLPPFPERVAKAVEISQAMQCLHQHSPAKVIHRDLKPINIFLDDAFHVRVADFGHARFLSDEEKALTGETGTHVYMAPEVIRCEPYDEKCDVYSFGVILNELITGEYPHIDTDYSPYRIAMEVAEGWLRPALPKEDEEEEDNQYKRVLRELVQVCWHEDAAARPTFASITSTLKPILPQTLSLSLSFSAAPLAN
ncbi:serine/threonine-protein kinase STY17-like [Diospyros lotus]|uniref:serine/threonine-protein kinase STY17-like n=1 Tax=Diospyros lotus TaxID=55363 RepID=UPI0022573F60|nr:serine/threonine-protein kinase STY17-like [Diospyros lotus]